MPRPSPGLRDGCRANTSRNFDAPGWKHQQNGEYELSDVRFVGPAGKALLAEMLRAGVKMFGRDALIRAIRDEVAASVLPKKRRRQRDSTDESDR